MQTLSNPWIVEGITNMCMQCICRQVITYYHLHFMSPQLVVEPLKLYGRILDVLLRLLPHIEDGAISAGAEHILMQRALTTLALRPQPRETDLQVRH